MCVCVCLCVYARWEEKEIDRARRSSRGDICAPRARARSLRGFIVLERPFCNRAGDNKRGCGLRQVFIADCSLSAAFMRAIC